MIRLKLQVQMAGLFTYSHEKGLLTFTLADAVQYKNMIYIANVSCAPPILVQLSPTVLHYQSVYLGQIHEHYLY
jgi:hypothetical protein